MRARKLRRAGSHPDEDALARAKLHKLAVGSPSGAPGSSSCPAGPPPARRPRVSVSSPPCDQVQGSSASVSSVPPKLSRFPSAAKLIAGGKLVQVLACLAKEKIVVFKHQQLGLPAGLRPFNKALRLTHRDAQETTRAPSAPLPPSADMRSLVLWCSQFWALLVELESLCSQRCGASSMDTSCRQPFAWLLDEDGLGAGTRAALVSALPFSFVVPGEAPAAPSAGPRSGGPQRVLFCALCGSEEQPLPRGSVCVQPCRQHSFCAECLVRAVPGAKVDFSPSSRLLHSSPCLLLFCPLCSLRKSQSVARQNALLSFCLMLWLCEKLTRPDSLPGLPLQDLRRADLLSAFERQQRVFGSKQWVASQTSGSLRVLVDEAVLTSRCPSCNQRCVNPLVDPSHSECLVVTCEACEHQFCGWCHFGLGHSGGRGREYQHTLTLLQHHHVKQCFWNPDKENLYISASHRRECEVMLRAFARRLVHDRVLASRPELREGCATEREDSSLFQRPPTVPEHWSCLWCGQKNSNSSGVCLGCGHNLFPWFISRLKALLNV